MLSVVANCYGTRGLLDRKENWRGVKIVSGRGQRDHLRLDRGGSPEIDRDVSTHFNRGLRLSIDFAAQPGAARHDLRQPREQGQHARQSLLQRMPGALSINPTAAQEKL
jgi:hypothetical protein